MRRNLLFIVVIFGYLYSFEAYGLNVQNFRPRTGTLSGFHLFTSETLPQYQLDMGLNLNWVSNPLEVGTPTNRQRGLVDDFVTVDFLASLGITDWLTFNVDVPVNLYHNIAPVFIANRDSGGADTGDIRVSAQFRLIDPQASKGNWGLALVPFVTLPSGNETVYFGDSNATGGLVVVGDKFIKRNHFYLNLGTRIREKESVGPTLQVNEELLMGIGFQRPLITKWDLGMIAEVSGSTVFSKFFDDDVTIPVDLHLVLQKKFLKEKNLTANLGITHGLTSGYSSPDVRVFTGVSYSFPLKKGKVQKPQEETSEVLFPFDKDRYYDRYNEVLNRVAQKWKENPSARIHIQAHTDNWGTNAYNDRLAERRARTVVQALIKRGVPQSQINSQGFGEEQPRTTNANPEGRQLNRRAEVIQIILR